MLYKYDLLVPFQAAVIGKLKRSTRRFNTGMSEIIPPKAYDSILPVSKSLETDLLALCKSNAILPQFHNYYAQLTTIDDLQNAYGDIDPNRDSDNEEDGI